MKRAVLAVLLALLALPARAATLTLDQYVGALEHLRARKPDDAQRVLASINPPLTPDQNFEKQMLGVELALARSQGQEAWRQIAAVPQPAGGPGVLRYLALRQRAALATGRAADGVRAEMARERLLVNPADRTAARSELLADLRTAQESGVRVEPRSVADNVVRGWLELAQIGASVARSPTTSIPDVEAWRTRYPNHPAQEVVGSELLGLKTEVRALRWDESTSMWDIEVEGPTSGASK